MAQEPDLPLDAERDVRGAPLRTSAVVVVAQRNNRPYIDACIGSILDQTYGDLGLVVLDDMSTDGTAEHLAATLPTHDRVVFVRNRVRRRKLENTLFAFRHLVERPDAIVFVVDGDDRLLRRSAVAELAARHRHADVVWSQFRFSDGRRGFCGPCPASPRTAKWRTSHLKSFKRSLFDRVPDAHLRDADGRVLSATEDMAYMFPMLELAGPRRRAFVDEELYFYRVHGGNMRRPLQLECEAIVRGRPPLAPAL